MLVIHRKHRKFEPLLPLVIAVNDQIVSVMKGNMQAIEAPHGSYSVRVQLGGRIPIGRKGRSLDLSLSGTTQVELQHAKDTHLWVYDRERVWNMLFDIDLIVWIVSLFVVMPPLYKWISDLFFVVWIVRLILIRKRYFKFIVSNTENG